MLETPAMTLEPDLVLASASPRRRELLESLGLILRIAPADIDERPLEGEAAADYVRRIAGSKCDRVVESLLAGDDAGAALAVVGADTTVIVDGDILGKPADAADARRMLERLAGRRHYVTTAYRVRRGDKAL